MPNWTRMTPPAAGTFSATWITRIGGLVFALILAGAFLVQSCFSTVPTDPESLREPEGIAGDRATVQLGARVGSTTGSPRHPEHGSHPRRVLRRCETARAGGGWCRPHRDHRRGVGAVPVDRAPCRSCRSRRRRDRRVNAGGSSEVTPMRISSRDRAPHLCRRRLTSPSRSRSRPGELSG